jgi:hypothetical protein
MNNNATRILASRRRLLLLFAVAALALAAGGYGYYRQQVEDIRRDLLGLFTHPTSPASKTIWMLLVVGTIPAAVIGFTLKGPIDVIFRTMVVAASWWSPESDPPLVAARQPMEQGRDRCRRRRHAQAFALPPGSAVQTMIAAGLPRGSNAQSARYAFLLGVPHRRSGFSRGQSPAVGRLRGFGAGTRWSSDTWPFRTCPPRPGA